MGRRGDPGRRTGKEAGGRGESAQLHPDLGGAGRGGSRALSWPHVSAPRVPLARGSPTRNPGTRGPARVSASRQSTAGAPPWPRPSPGPGPAPPRVLVPGPGSQRERGGDCGGAGRREHALPGRPGGRSSLCNRAGRRGPMRWRPRLLLNENKRSTWARLRSHVSPRGQPGAVGVLLGPGATRPASQVPLPAAAEDSPASPDPFPGPRRCPGLPISPVLLRFLPAGGSSGKRKRREEGTFLPRRPGSGCRGREDGGDQGHCSQAPSPPKLLLSPPHTRHPFSVSFAPGSCRLMRALGL